MTQELKIDKEFEAHCPPLTTEELALLSESLLDDGCRDPIIVWANNEDTILDGHNRYRICKSHNIPFKVKAIAKKDRNECLLWITNHQLGRRNLTENQKSYLRGKHYEAEKKAHGGAEFANAKAIGHSDQSLPTSTKIAEQAGVGEKTVRRDAKFAQAVDALAEVQPELRTEILSEKAGLTRKAVVEIAKQVEDGGDVAVLVEEKRRKPPVQQEERKEATWAEQLKWAARQKSVNKTDLQEKFGYSTDTDCRKRLACAAQTAGYLVTEMEDGEYRVRKAITIPAEEGASLKDAMKKLAALANEAMGHLTSNTSAGWEYQDQTRFIGEVRSIAKAFLG